jgi:hypothetical protein
MLYMTDEDPQNPIPNPPEENQKSPDTEVLPSEPSSPAESPQTEPQLVEEGQNVTNQETPSETSESQGAEPEPEPEKDWQEILDEHQKNIPKEELKRRQKEAKEKAKLEKQKALEAKAQSLVDQQFSMTFNPRVLPFTMIFFAIIAAMFFIGTLARNNPDIYWIQVTIGLSGILGFFILFQFSRVRSIHDRLFAEGKFGFKLFMVILSMALAFIPIWLYWSVSDPTGPIGLPRLIELAQLPAPLQYSILFGTILTVVYFGWNIIQIVFIRVGLENVSLNVQLKMENKFISLDNKSKESRYTLFNFLLGLIPFLLIPLTVWFLLIAPDTPEFYAPFVKSLDIPQDWITGRTGKFTPEFFYFGEWLANKTYAADVSFFVKIWDYFIEVWWGTMALRYIVVWYLVVTILMISMTVHQHHLQQQAKIHKSPNIFSNMFHMLLWIILWAKTFAILKGLLTFGNNPVIGELSTFDLLIDTAADFILMLLTVVMAMRSFGIKMSKANISNISKYNVTLVSFMFTISYFGGQLILIANGLANEDLKFITNFIVLIVDVAFYFWYSKWILERKGFTRRTSYTLYETKDLLVDLSQQLKNNLLQTLENEEIVKNTLNKFLLDKKIALESAGEGGQDGVVGTLTKEEIILDAEKKLERAEAAYLEARTDQDNYEKAVKEYEVAKQMLQELQSKRTGIEQEIQAIPTDTEAKFAQLTSEKDALIAQLQEKKRTNNLMKDTFKNLNNQISKLNSQLISFSGTPTLPTAEGETPELVKSPEQTSLEEQLAALNKQKVQLTSDIDSSNTELQKMEQDVTEISEKWSNLQKLVQELVSKRDQAAQLEIDITELGAKIEKMAENLEYLKEKAVSSQPFLSAAEGAKISAEKEVEALNQTGDAKANLVDAEQKLKVAEEKFNKDSNILKMAEVTLAATKPIPDCKQAIAEAQDKIVVRTKIVQDAQELLAQKEQILQEKKAKMDAATADVQAAHAVVDQVKDQIKLAEKELERTKAQLQLAEDLKKELDGVRAQIKEVEGRKAKIKSPKDIEADISAENKKEKEAKSKLDALNKERQTTGGVSDGDITKASDELEKIRRKIGDLREKLNESKAIYNELEGLHKKEKGLQEKQKDIPAAKAEVEKATQALKTAQDALIAPTKDLEQKNVILNQAQAEFDTATGERDVDKVRLSQAEADLRAVESEKAQEEKNLADRENAEAAHKEATKNMKISTKVLETAKEFLAKRQNELANAEKSQSDREEDAALDWKIYLAHKDLRMAQVTLQEAIRSAQANINSRQKILDDAIAAKADVLTKRQESAAETISVSENEEKTSKSE